MRPCCPTVSSIPTFVSNLLLSAQLSCSKSLFKTSILEQLGTSNWKQICNQNTTLKLQRSQREPFSPCFQERDHLGDYSSWKLPPFCSPRLERTNSGSSERIIFPLRASWDTIHSLERTIPMKSACQSCTAGLGTSEININLQDATESNPGEVNRVYLTKE